MLGRRCASSVPLNLPRFQVHRNVVRFQVNGGRDGKKEAIENRRYTDEFKLESVKLAQSVGCGQAAMWLGSGSGDHGWPGSGWPESGLVRMAVWMAGVRSCISHILTLDFSFTGGRGHTGGRSQVLHFLYSHPRLFFRVAPFTSNSPTRSITSPPVVIGARKSTVMISTA